MNELSNLITDYSKKCFTHISVEQDGEFEKQVKQLMIETHTKAYKNYVNANDNLDSDMDMEDFMKQEVEKL